ncbi:ATP-binding cassette domain-containing protein [Anaerolentibacter hominis]|uniref:ATP-binding cassette domain-containing protein n=1 Tax=Anaerolentibacter hominis TaxID=3079009 RepID=UPI0031B866C8
MLEIENLTKKYRDKTALNSVSLTLEKGVYGLLGPNGAGKSTLMKLITDNLLPDAGSISWDGQPVRQMGKKYRKLLGFTPQQQGLYDEFTGLRFLTYMALLKEIPGSEVREEVLRCAGLVNMTSHLDKRIAAYSGGMKQRILIAQAVLGSPCLLVFDEPTAGLDPLERIRIRNLLAGLAKERTVLIATHVVSDIETIADSILLLKDGHLLAQGPPAELIREFAPDSTLEDVYLKLFGDKEIL